MQTKNNKIIPLVVFISYLCASLLYSSSAEFLNLNLDVRTAALGDVSSVYTYPFSSVYGNPANCVGIRGLEFGYTQWVADIGGNSFIAGYSFGSGESPKVGVGFGYTSLGTEFINVTTQNGIKYSDSLLSLVIGYQLFKKLRLGASVKNYLQQMDTISNTAVLCDIGCSFITKKIVLGLTLKNVGGSLSETKQELPTRIDAGFKFVILEKEEQQKINMFVECSNILNDKTVYKVSAEYIYLDTLVARMGYKFNTDIDRFSLGIGTKLKIPRIKLKTSIDLSYIPFGGLGEVVKVAFGIKF